MNDHSSSPDQKERLALEGKNPPGLRDRDTAAPTANRLTSQQLAEELRIRQRRLGTAEESPDDFSEIRELAHRLNNQLTAELLQDSLDRDEIDDDPLSPPALPQTA